MKGFRLIPAVFAPLLAMLVSTPPAAAGQFATHTCSSASPTTPGIIAPGTYGDLTVAGFCVIPGGTVTVREDLRIMPGASLFANFPAVPAKHIPEGDATVLVRGDVWVGSGATLILGCSPHLGCVNTTSDRVGGTVTADRALGVIFHSDVVGGDILQTGGGGGVNCTPTGIFTLIGSPVYSDYEDTLIRGHVGISGLRSCWLGLARDRVGESVRLVGNTLFDPDAIEVIANHISDNLACFGNSMVWDSADATPMVLFPRVPEPNTVRGDRAGQCRLSSPTKPGGPTGPGPF